jgi:hypothetical protein
MFNAPGHGVKNSADNFSIITFRLLIIISLSFSFAFGQDSFLRKIKTFEKYNSKYIKFTFTNIDSVKTSLSLQLQFYFNNKATEILCNKINLTDKPTINNHSINLIFDNLTLADSSYWLMYNDSAIIKTINNVSIKTSGRFIIGLQPKKVCSILYLYFEFNPDEWYFFKYDCGLMVSLSTNEDFNKILTKAKHKSKDSYSYDISNRKNRDEFLYKLMRTRKQE